MKVLDLDMDFFLSGPCPLAPLGSRPDPDCARAWTREEVVSFLERQCGLSTSRPVPGALFDTHDKALDFWLSRLRDGTLTAPFEVAHVDTHSDLAFGPPGPDFVLKAVLTKHPAARATPANYRRGIKLDEANYLLFALAFRWISRLCYVQNPHSLKDVPPVLLAPDGSIRLESAISRLMEGANGREPSVPFTVCSDYRTFSEDGFDFVTMAQSPRYAPESADFILDVLSPYILPVPFSEFR